MDLHELRRRLEDALKASIAWEGRDHRSNHDRSRYFCGQVGRQLKGMFQDDKYSLRQIGYDEDKRTFTSGEWLLDGAIVEIGAHKIVKQIRVAMECESATALTEFATDFGKLINVRARTKIYLHGLNQTTAQAAKKLIEGRLHLASEFIGAHDPDSEWLIAFWPSPEKTRTFPSLWDSFEDRALFGHIADIRLFVLEKGAVHEVRPDGTCVPVDVRPCDATASSSDALQAGAEHGA